MPMYLSQHMDYTQGGSPSEVDRPAPPLVTEAASAEDAMRTFAILENELYASDLSMEDIADETTLVLLDPVFEELRKRGWVIKAPERSGDK